MMDSSKHNVRAEMGTLLILSLVNGIVGLDRLAVNFLSPFYVRELGLDNTQLGLFSTALSVAIAATGIVISSAADSTGRQQRILVWVLIAFSLLSAGSGLATSFLGLFAARFLLGLAEGPLAPLTLSIMHGASHPSRRGLNLGTMQVTGAFAIGAMVGPLFIISMAQNFGWKMAFFASAIPGLVCAALVAIFVKHKPVFTPQSATASGDPLPSLLSLLKSKNLLLSMAIAALFTAWLTVQNVFMPRYITESLGMSGDQLKWILSITGFGGLVGGAAIPALSDRFGRRTMVVIASLASVATPLILLNAPASATTLAVLLMLSWLTLGCAPLVCAIIPSESVPPARTATAVALSMCTAELIGGALTPPLAGWAADIWGLRAPFIIDIALAFACAALGLMLKETLKRDQA